MSARWNLDVPRPLGRSARLGSHDQSEIRAITARVDAVGGINLGQGLCRVPPPGFLLRMVADDFQTGDHTYGPTGGSYELRAAIARKLSRHNGLVVDPDREVLATSGATAAFAAAVHGLLDPGDGLLLVEPFYGYHRAIAELAGIAVQTVRTWWPDLTITAPALEAAVDRCTRAIVLCTPSNPAGRCLTDAELDLVADVAQAHDLLVITDEIYEHILLGAVAHRSPATHPGLAERTVSISGLSKTFSVPGWRLGYASGSEHLIAAMRLAADILYICPPVPFQKSAALALDDDRYLQSLGPIYRSKFDLVRRAFEIAGLVVHRPDGAYYALVDAGALGVATGREASDLLLDRASVGTVPLEAFMVSPTPGALVRVCFSVPDDELLALEHHLHQL